MHDLFVDFQLKIFPRSYHDEEHYNSVRLMEDTCAGPARPIIIKVSFCFSFFLFSYGSYACFNQKISSKILISPITRFSVEVKGDAVPSASSLPAKALATNSKKRGESAISPGNVKLVMAGSGCQNSKKVEKVIG